MEVINYLNELLGTKAYNGAPVIVKIDTKQSSEEILN